MAEHVLQQESPAFLDHLDSDPPRAFEEFYLFARKLLAVCPPSILWEAPDDLRQDLVHDVILSCCHDDFRVLRGYRAQGKPFAAWFFVVTKRKILDRVRTAKGADWIRGAVEAPSRPSSRQESPVDRVVGARVALELVLEQIRQLGEICQILLLGAAEGRPPRELVSLLGWPSDWNKKASDDLRDCRRRLIKRLELAGLDPAELVDP